jgi:transcriptional regulator with XRE-family HTH domain
MELSFSSSHLLLLLGDFLDGTLDFLLDGEPGERARFRPECLADRFQVSHAASAQSRAYDFALSLGHSLRPPRLSGVHHHNKFAETTGPTNRLETWSVTVGRQKKLQTVQGRLRHLRQTEGLSVAELTDRVNAHLPKRARVTQQTVSNYESPARPPPRVDWIRALLAAFPDLSVSWLVLGKGAMTLTAEERRIAGLLDLERRGPDPFAEFFEGVAGRTWMAVKDIDLYLPVEATSLAQDYILRLAESDPARLGIGPAKRVPDRDTIRAELEAVLSRVLSAGYGSAGELVAACLAAFGEAYLREFGSLRDLVSQPAPLRRVVIADLQESLKGE